MFRRRTRGAALVAAATAVLAAAAPVDAAAAPRTVVLATGLDRPVEVVTDRWGVPHVYAASAADAYLAQGFAVAADRLFQLDLGRRRGLGTLAEVLGPAHAERDRAARLFLYRGDMAREWAAYGPEAKTAATRFAAGINAYIDWVERNPAALPPEFGLLGHRPARWSAEDVVRIRTHALTQNLSSEVTRARVACAAGVRADRVRLRLQPEHDLAVPDGFDPCSLPADVLATYELATGSVAFTGTGVTALPAAPASAEGSNNWAIGPGRTTTGRPILANDPHRTLGSPSTRYLTHLSAPGLDVIGAGDPAAPGIAAGHNGTAAFGLTVFPVDQEDLYVYQLDPADPTRYRYGDGWERMRTTTERIAVRGEAPRDVELSFTRHGPVIRVDAAEGVAYAVRTAWLEPGTAGYLGSLRLLRAGGYAEFVEQARAWGAPAENLVYADTAGDIGMVSVGLAPKRVGYDGLLPVPGDGRYEWNGFVDGAALPQTANPPQGFVASANQYNLPEGYPVEGLSYEWNNPSRYERIVEVLGGKRKSSVADSVALQSDRLSIPARRLTAVLAGLTATDPDAAAALDLLRGWDAVMTEDTAAGALFETWVSRHLGPAFVRAVAPTALPHVLQPDNAVLVSAVEDPVPWFGSTAVRDQLVLATLAAAHRDLATTLGPDRAAWRWGSLQTTTFTHPLSAVRGDTEWNVGSFPRGGAWYTVDASVYHPVTRQQLLGASFRMVLDVGGWDRSRAVNTPGQSGDPRSPHYRDLADRWQAGETVPLLYSRGAVLRNAERVTVLLPGRR
ncbi:penicillin acylase family protein [Actinokineospora spheciospongiae]|uniref:penicillin acylase family protein n=1 Tax=Actinokineospora spheciospongiae TaxID=909613 RepID=UPI000D961A72|nr:penicillin acylase family protein [Actinokineospora spheciospongiae]PWW59607.1 penicillin amidase [Actinokineospora spheciospongiae]